jgi:hypothetical protein
MDGETEREMEKDTAEEGVPEEDRGYVESKAKQDEFEELAREEGFDEAAKDAAKGKKPKKGPPTSSSA